MQKLELKLFIVLLLKFYLIKQIIKLIQMVLYSLNKNYLNNFLDLKSIIVDIITLFIQI